MGTDAPSLAQRVRLDLVPETPGRLGRLTAARVVRRRPGFLQHNDIGVESSDGTEVVVGPAPPVHPAVHVEVGDAQHGPTDDRRATSWLVPSWRWQQGMRIWPGGCSPSPRRSSPPCPSSRWRPARSTSVRASPTPTGPRSCARWRSPPSGRAATSTRPARASPSSVRLWRHTSATGTTSSSTPSTDVLVTVGATEAIAATMLALCEPGDEVVMFEPTYDSYAACASMAGATPRLVRLHPPDWHFDPGELAAAVGPRTKMVLAQHAAQPDRQGVLARRIGAGRRALYRPRPPGGDRRGVRAPGLRRRHTSRWPPCPAWASAPSPSRRVARRSPSPGGRWGGSAAPRPWWPRCERRSSS